MVGKKISHYKILEKLGGGGMGVVYKAKDTNLDRIVALKFLPLHMLADKNVEHRFVSEAKAASSFDHPNICTIHEIGKTDDDQLFIAMACYEGETLKKKIEKGPLQINEVIDITLQIAKGLNVAHQKGIIHRDIKPANIFITNNGTVKILDFGLAKSSTQNTMTQLGSTMGTVAYMSPEQTTGSDVDHRSDIWSLGVVMYEMLTGKPPFRGQYDQAIIYSILNENPEPILNQQGDAPKKFSSIIEIALLKEPEKRFQTIEELLIELKEFDSGELTLPIVGAKQKLLKYYPVKKIGLTALILLVALAIWLTAPFESNIPQIKSLIVLPFENYTGNNKLEYFIAGMHASLIGEISKVSALRIISKTTSNAYKNAGKTISDIASELNVDAAIETSVMGLGDSINIQVKLISGFPEEQQIWLHDYVKANSEILNLYTSVAKEITKEINVALTTKEKELLTESREIDPDAYDAYIKGQFLMERLGKEDLFKSIDYFKIAIEKEPTWALPYIELSHSWSGLQQMGRVKPTVAMPKIYANLNKASELDPNSPNLHAMMAELAVWTEWDWEKGDKEFKKALELNPNDSRSRILYAHFLLIMNRLDEARYHANLAIELDPLRPLLLGLYAMVMVELSDCQSALTQAKKALSIDPKSYFAKGALSGAYYCLGDTVKWFEAWKTRAWWNDSTIAVINNIFYDQGFHNAIEKIIEVNEEAAKKMNISMWGQTQRYLRINNIDKAMDCLERAYDIHDPNIPYVGTLSREFENLKNNSRYIALVDKLELPID